MTSRQKVPLFLGLLGFLCLLLPNTATADSFDWTYQGTKLNMASGILDSGSSNSHEAPERETHTDSASYGGHAVKTYQ
jgi:hypothetical protein